MNPNFTYLRTCICFLLLSIAFTNSYSQSSKVGNITSDNSFYNLHASVEKNNLLIMWNASDATSSNYCEVQSSEDGKTFSTIGMVMGADPKQTHNGFAFKQDMNKMKAGHIFYRILTIDGNNKAFASNVFKATK
ncbi:MAG: hypothetical protein ABIO04_05900 [Ferruginibacter sp.]